MESGTNLTGCRIERLRLNVILSRQAKNLVSQHPVMIQFFTEFILERSEGFRMTSNVNRALRHSFPLRHDVFDLYLPK